MNRTNKFILSIALLIVPILTLNATITVDNYWKFGENDPSAISGAALNTTTLDSAGSNTLTLNGAGQYTAATINPGFSSLGAALAANAYYTSASTSFNGTDNFGIEGFFNLSSGGGYLLHHGDTNLGNGYGLYLQGTQLVGHFSGVTFINGPTISLNTWIHLALVRDNGMTTVYMNGAAVGTDASSIPSTPTAVYIGDAQMSGRATTIDNVRLFHFTAGQFQTSDLLYASAIPEPHPLPLFAGALLIVVAFLKRTDRNRTLATP